MMGKAMRYRLLALMLATAVPGCAANSFSPVQWDDGAQAPAWRRPAPPAPPGYPAPMDSARA
jgi:hypothetical protein